MLFVFAVYLLHVALFIYCLCFLFLISPPSLPRRLLSERLMDGRQTVCHDVCIAVCLLHVALFVYRCFLFFILLSSRAAACPACLMDGGISSLPAPFIVVTHFTPPIDKIICLFPAARYLPLNISARISCCLASSISSINLLPFNAEYYFKNVFLSCPAPYSINLPLLCRG